VEKATGESPKPYPKAVFFIIATEFCERFSYYGMRTILTLYLINMLMFDESTAKSIYHVFIMGCYFSPVLGAMIADSYLGKFRTIFYISIVYAIGNITLAVSATPPLLDQIWIPMVGLTVIAFGTGGIKPCVAAFGGDQFGPGQEKQLEQFFSLFYLSINAGSLLSTFITPILRVQKCMGQMYCFPLAYGVPAALMVVALVLFVIGKPMYKMVPPAGNVVVQVMGCIFHAVSVRFKSKEKKAHWLDYSEDKYDKSLISDIKDLLHVLVLYVPLPIFWALFDQQGSQWTLQANKMDGEFFGLQVLPDQMQVVNPFLILILVPFFAYIVYPLFARCNLLNKPLQKITIGGLAAAAAFGAAGCLDLVLEVRKGVPYSVFTSSSHLSREKLNTMLHRCLGSRMSVHKEVLVTLLVCACFLDSQIHVEKTLPALTETSFSVNRGPSCPSTLQEATVKFTFEEKKAFAVVFSLDVSDPTKIVASQVRNRKRSRDVRWRPWGTRERVPANLVNVSLFFYFRYAVKLLTVDDIVVATCNTAVRNGGVYMMTFVQDQNNKSVQCMTHMTIEPNSLHMFYQIPQYVLITAGEVMFSVTGLEFSYSQAPTSMKSVVQAAWLITVAVGNLIVVIVAKARFFNNASAESFMYCGLMGLDMLIFAIVAYFYKYITPGSRNPAVEDEKHSSREPPAYQNNVFEGDTKM
ncbi:oligopeptide transporter, putative, partial [Ixodes scapularis]